jgi:hypothetical protein
MEGKQAIHMQKAMSGWVNLTLVAPFKWPENISKNPINTMAYTNMTADNQR